MSAENRFDLAGEVAVVLGGTGGLGGAMAEGLAAAGAKVAILGRNKERGETRAKEISKSGKAI
ncbi:MAG: SDR family NAD(P)-dependent oxidoreductase, partial [Verrucomicrobia bacterium]|nr:SDR family NAD(P)-dependent oxidoreductase [Verrucomicrobiota bacterium]